MPENPNPTTNPNPAPTPPTPPTGAGTGPVSPEEALKKLKELLAQQESDLGTKTKQKDELKTHVEALTKIVDEIKKSSGGFGTGSPALAEEVKKITDHYHAELTGVEAVLKEKKRLVQAAIDEVKAEIKAQWDKVNDRENGLKVTAEKADAAYEKAKKSLDEKQKEYDDLKDLQKTLGDNVKKLRDLENKIEAFDKQTKPASEYVLLQEEKELLEKTIVPSQEEYERRLNAAWQALDAARTDLRDKKLAAGTAKEALDKGQAALKQLEDNRVAKTLERVEEFNKTE